MKKKQPPCQRCGARQFHVRYTETAHAVVADDGDILEDGYNLVHHEMNWDQAWCAKCNAKVKWTGPEN